MVFFNMTTQLTPTQQAMEELFQILTTLTEERRHWMRTYIMEQRQQAYFNEQGRVLSLLEHILSLSKEGLPSHLDTLKAKVIELLNAQQNVSAVQQAKNEVELFWARMEDINFSFLPTNKLQRAVTLKQSTGFTLLLCKYIVDAYEEITAKV